MSGYKPGYSEEHSPWWNDGRFDAQRDAILVSTCPGNPPMGMNAEKLHSAMYRRGYESVPQVPHVPCKSCRREAS